MMEASDEIRAALARGATVLTGRALTAREIRRAVDAHHCAAGMTGWAPPRVFAWDSWTIGLWREMLLRGDVAEMLLNRTQEAAIWRLIVESDDGITTLRDSSSLAALAAEAWGALARHEGLRRLAGSARNAHMEAFARWAGLFEARCREQRYVAQARLEAALRGAWRGHPDRLPPEQEILLVGFDRVLAAQAGLLNDLRAAGCMIREASPGPLASERVLVRAGDESAEIRAAAMWLRQSLDQRPRATIALLVPGLKGSPLLLAKMDRVLRDVLAPEAQAVGTTSLPYEFSTGLSIASTGSGRAAMSILAWAHGALALPRVEELLLSSHFAGGVDLAVRAEFEEFDLRRKMMLKPEMTLAALLERVEASGRQMPELLPYLHRMHGVVVRSVGAEKTYADWAGVMRDLLGAAGWRDGSGDSTSFQAQEMWEGVLDEMATLDFAGRRVAYVDAIDALSEIASRTVFAEESRGAPVQVMGPEEAAGLSFDAVWFLHAGEFNWPAVAAGSPLVAWELRRELGMPGADGAADMEQARRATELIARSCGKIVFSYARQAGEQERQRESAALKGLPLQEIDEPGFAPGGRLVELEVVEDVGRVTALPQGSTPGGIAVLKAQAACAFHAFAEYRLFATERKVRELGMNASERGQAVHAMLEHFWAEIQTQKALKAMTAEQRRTELGRAIDRAFEKMRVEGVAWDDAYRRTERDRLLRLGMLWLTLEEGRTLPFEVKQRESEREIAVGPLMLKVRLDRIDATDEGSVLIDYKSGGFGPAAWLGERPDEPQLPFYAALAGEMQLHAVAFGLVRAGKEMKLTGYADSPGTLKMIDIPEGTLQRQVDAWRDVMVGLAEEFAHGDTRVSPKAYPGTCKYCPHRLICRLQAQSLTGEDGEEFELEEDRG